MTADVANISAKKSEKAMCVTFDLLNPDDADLVREVAEKHGFEQYGDTGERFESVSYDRLTAFHSLMLCVISANFSSQTGLYDTVPASHIYQLKSLKDERVCVLAMSQAVVLPHL